LFQWDRDDQRRDSIRHDAFATSPETVNNTLNGILLGGLILCILYATLAFAAVSVEFAAPVYAMAMFLAVCWAAKLLFAKQVSWMRSPMHWPVAAFAIYATVRYLTSPIEYDSRLELFHVGLYTFIYFLAATTLHRQRDRTALVIALMVLATAETVYGFWQFAKGADVVLNADRPEQYHGRASGTFICPNHFAGFLEIVLGLLLARIAIHRSLAATLEQRVIQKLLEIFVALIVLAGIVTSLSRGGWVATAAGFVVFAFWGWRARAIPPAAAAAVVGALVLAAAAAMSVPSVRHRLAETVAFGEGDKPIEIKDVTMSGRLAMWQGTMRMIPDHLWFGTGPLTWEWFHLKYRDPRLQIRPRYVHHDVLQLISDYGLVGFALVAAIFACFFWHAARLSRPRHSPEQRAFATGAAVAVAMILVHSFVDFNMHIPANAVLLATLMGLTVAMENGNGQPRRVQMKRLSRIALAASLLALTGIALWFGAPMARASHNNFWGNACKEVLAWDRALQFYQRAVAADPRFPEPYARMGDVYRARSALQARAADEANRKSLARQAIQAYQRSLELNPYQSEVMLRLAHAYELAGDNDSALKTYYRALAVDPNNAFSYQRLGIFYRHMGEDELAAEAFEKSDALGSQDQIAIINIEDIRRRVSPPQ
jgi:O-antigen ligase